MDQIIGRLDIGWELYGGDGIGVRLQYTGEFSNSLTSHGASLRLTLLF